MAQGIRDMIKDTAKVADLAKDAKDAALLNGVLMRTKEASNSAELVTYAPFTLFPTPVPKAVFQQALDVQTHYNSLVDRISQNTDFLKEALASTIEVDEFTSRLFKIHKQTLKEGISQSVVLGLNRSDYMLDGSSSLKQIEINTISASFGGLAAGLVGVHKHILKVAGRLEDSMAILDNNPAAGLARAISKAKELYGAERAVVLILVSDDEQNIYDQRCVELELMKLNVFTIRRTFEDVCARGSLDKEKRLIIDGLEVALVYFRNGYAPQQYKSQQDWDTRLMLERSRAIKCPDIATHLTGTKKVQQVLARPGVLERFFPNEPRVVEQIRATFAGLYTLDMGPEGDTIVAMALKDPEKYVLKPQREGGGNNIYGSEICKVLQEAKGSERMAYILMDKINSTPSHNYLLRQDSPLTVSNCLSELGIFGAYVRQGTEMVMNEQVGHLLRTKSSAHADGGVAAGVAVLDNPFLY
ncbi:glutathione synthetase [Eucyclogobius newberryi]|uniref:glutathione synthetase n=1 Tax=Eucyclogobius newberryi TaxID=166745 RepID=UPI003B594063